MPGNTHHSYNYTHVNHFFIRMKRGLAIAFGLTQDQEVNDEDSSDEQENN